jgi:NAD(P)-dependent dehydrogenase (short-subunit alcohol dehydrogenase family)
MNITDIFSLNNTVSLVTGASGHIGRVISTALAQYGSHVILQGSSYEKVQNLHQKLASQNLSSEIACFDLRSEASVREYFEKFKHSKINVLINNAYRGGAGTIETTTTDDFRNSMEMSLTVPYLMMKSALPFFKKALHTETRSIINISSMYGIVSPDLKMYKDEKQANPPYYGAGKAGLVQLTKYSAVEFAKYAIRVNAISPGPFPNNEALKDSSLIKAIEERSLLGRVGQTHELIGAILYLASNASSYVTGSNIIVDGGWTVR